MYPLQHIILGGIFSLALLILFPHIGLTGAFLVFASSVLIDVDHYLYYVYKKKDWSLKRAYWWFVRRDKKFLTLSRTERNKYSKSLVLLHGIEILILLFLISFFYNFVLFIFTGFSFHLLLDLIYGTLYIDRMDRVSLIYDFFKFRKLKYYWEK